MKNSVYTQVFDLYELTSKKKGEKEKIRKFINRQLTKSFGEKDSWHKLDDSDKNIFLYSIIRVSMLELYIDRSCHSTIIKKLNNIPIHNKNYLDHIKDHDKIVEQIRTPLFNPSDPVSEQRINYEKHYKLVCYFFGNYPVPSFDEWVEICSQNKNFRPYDDIQSYNGEIMNTNIFTEEDMKFYPTESQINSILFKTIIKIIEEKMNIQIDREKIFDDLFFTNLYYFNPLEPYIQKGDHSDDAQKFSSEKFCACSDALKNCDYYSAKESV